ncbi:MAG: ribonuclease III [Alphaproteobacteria bacterium]|nr:ribonuclease III [Alphaproteobacteria bacterium]
MENFLSSLEEKICYNFKNTELLRVALTHSSTGESQNYERLEFLGDRVLGLVIASLLFEKFPDEKEGDLAKRLASLVQGRTLARISEQIDLGTFIILSDAERVAGGATNEHILADVFEALIGAMYLDGDLELCERFIAEQWDDVLYTMKTPPQHPKTAIQEWAQAKGLPLPAYEIIEQTGPDHAPEFKVQLLVKGHNPFTASGRSRAEAEKEVAKLFLETIDLSKS